MAEQEFATDIFHHRVRLVGSARTSDALMSLARKRANDPTIFDQHSPIFFAVEASNNRMDSYFTRMSKPTLENFLKDARAGVSFQDSHRTRELGLGGTLDADLHEEGDLVRLTADVYVMPGLPELDAFIHRWRAGIARDVSVGFYGGKHICALCNRNIWSWDCPHIPGVEYDVETRDEQGNITSKRRAVAFAWIDGARLSEISAVYDGATPGCAILKAQREADAGRMTPDVANLLEGRYRGLRLNGAHHRWPGVELQPATAAHPLLTQLSEATEKLARLTAADPGAILQQGVIPMPEPISPTGSQPGDEPRAVVSSPATTASALPATAEPTMHERLVTDLVTEAALSGDVQADFREVSAQLRQMVKDGLAYRQRVVADALTAGVRLFGNDFDKAGTEALFVRAGVEQIRAMGEQWNKSADQLFPAGRQTVDEIDPDPTSKLQGGPSLPDTVFGS